MNPRSPLVVEVSGASVTEDSGTIEDPVSCGCSEEASATVDDSSTADDSSATAEEVAIASELASEVGIAVAA